MKSIVKIGRGVVIGVFCVVCMGVVSLYAQNKIIAVVNNDVITSKDMNDFLHFMSVQYSKQYGEAEWESKLESIKKDILDRLIEDRLILQEAKKGDMKPDPSRVKARLEDMKKKYGSDEEFRKTLAAQGLVMADVESKIAEQIMMQMVVEEKVRSKIIVRPSEVTAFYDEHMADFQAPEDREFESITFNDEVTAKAVVQELREGVDLATIAAKYAFKVNRVRARKGGELKKAIEDVVFTMKINEVSDPANIEGSFYVFRLGSIISSRQEPFEQVQEKIFQFLYEKKLQEMMVQWLDTLKKKSYIKVESE